MFIPGRSEVMDESCKCLVLSGCVGKIKVQPKLTGGDGGDALALSYGLTSISFIHHLVFSHDVRSG